MSRALLVAVVAGVAAALSAGALAAGPPPAAAASRGASAELACRAAPPVARSIVHHVAISTDDMPAGMSEPVALPAPCLSTTAAGSLAVLVDKRHPLSPRDYRPSDLRRVALPGGFLLRAPAAAALERLSAAAHRAGHGTLGVASAFRSYGFQKSLYSRYVGAKGPVWADRASARPGYSEHQTGLAVDVVACTPACGTIDGFGASGTGRWVAANAWRYGFIVRYEPGRSATTGYASEPWHLRFVGAAVAADYHAGGFHTLEQYLGYAAAAAY